MTPSIIFEDETLLVINKPAGLVVNRAETTRGKETVEEWSEKKLKIENEKRKITDQNEKFEDFYERVGIVHRLDKETSGLLLIAKTPEAFAHLQAQFKNRQVKKKYLALVHGQVVPAEGEIKAPVGRLPWRRERFGVIPGGREAVTKYRRLSVFRYQFSDSGSSAGQSASQRDRRPITEYSLLELSPLTGRTHQIRVHLKYLGCPIVGDSFYAGRKQARQDRQVCPRMFLHASYLAFQHPKTSNWLEFNSALPDDLVDVLKRWRT